VDQVIDRIVAGEQQFLAQMKEVQPFVETYIQQMDPTGSTPSRDDYMLMRLDLTKNAGETSMAASAAFKQSLLQGFYTSQMKFRSAGFEQMAFPDNGSFNRATYTFSYSRREFLGDVRCLVFDVAPLNEKEAGRFVGNIWVDDRDYQIVKSYGKAVPDIRKHGEENLFPRFETYRQQIDAQYWFPTWTGADDTLNFSTGAQRIRMIVRYENYKQFKSAIKITYGDEAPAPKSKP